MGGESGQVQGRMLHENSTREVSETTESCELVDTIVKNGCKKPHTKERGQSGSDPGDIALLQHLDTIIATSSEFINVGNQP